MHNNLYLTLLFRIIIIAATRRQGRGWLDLWMEREKKNQKYNRNHVHERDRYLSREGFTLISNRKNTGTRGIHHRARRSRRDIRSLSCPITLDNKSLQRFENRRIYKRWVEFLAKCLKRSLGFA